MFLKIKPKLLFLALIGFFITVLVLLIQVNYIIYLALTDIFHVFYFESLLLGIFLALFSGLFMIMLLIERFYSNKIIRYIYVVTSAWMGVLVYFFMSAVVYITANIFIYIPKDVGVLLFLLAAVVSVYGLVHGKKIVVKNIEVSLPLVNKEWKGKTAVWMSDLHLGPIHGTKLAERVVKLSNSLSPEVVFIGGDLYDGSHTPNPFIIAKPLKNLFSRSGVFFVTGNHEEFRDPSVFLLAVLDLGIQVLDDRMVEINGLQIIGVDYLNASNKKRFKNTLENMKIDKNKPSILLKHEPSNLKVAHEAGISFQISGHTHNGQQWPFNYLTRLMYKGYNYGLKYYSSMPVYVSSGAGGWGPTLRVGSNCEIVCIKFI